MDPSKKKRARKDNDSNLTGLQCDCCKNLITLSEDNHIQNNPCEHIVCLLCVVKSNMNRAANPSYFCCQCQVENCSQKFTTSCQYFNRGMPGEIIKSVVQLSKDVIPSILSFLPLNEIMQKRGVCTIWNEAAKKTIAPLTDFRVDSVEKYNAVNVMTRALPNLQQIDIRGFGIGQKYSDGEDPDQERADALANWTPHDVEIISNFSKLGELKIYNAPLNGRYPFLFNSFPLLQKLSIQLCYYLKWDLEMLSGFPLLKEFDSDHNYGLTGNINSLRVGVLKDTLEKVKINNCDHVQGNFTDLADFPHLKELDLYETAVTGDIRDIGEHDFTSLESLILPKGVYGGYESVFQRISDAPDVVRAVYLLQKQRPALKMEVEDWHCRLSEDSHDRYDSVEEDDTPPFDVTFVKAGIRSGYRWETDRRNPCEVNWLDPEPDRDSSDYEEYIEELQEIEQVNQYRGFHQPPTEEEYHRVYTGNVEEIDE